MYLFLIFLFLQIENSNAHYLPEGKTLENAIYAPIRQVIEKYLLKPEVKPDEVSNNESGDSKEKQLPLDEEGKPLNYYSYLTSLNDEPNVVESTSKIDDVQGEKFLYGEIDKFRQRQLQRDKVLEKQRAEKIRVRLEQIERMKLLAEKKAKEQKEQVKIEEKNQEIDNKRKLDESSHLPDIKINIDLSLKKKATNSLGFNVDDAEGLDEGFGTSKLSHPLPSEIQKSIETGEILETPIYTKPVVLTPEQNQEIAQLIPNEK